MLADFDLDRIGAALDGQRDNQFTFLGLQTLYDRYFLHDHGTRYELPQAFFMRVAMGLAIREIDREGRAIEFYRLLSSFDFMSSTPTLFNAGTTRPQLSSCFLTTVADDLDDIFQSIKHNALLAKYSGGLGNDWTPVRGIGAHIKGTNGLSSGVVPFLKIANDTAVAVNQGGKRKGAVCAYLETWHVDIEEFLDLRKNTGDDRRRTHDMNTANWIPDEFLRRVEADGQWTLFSPDEVPDLHDLVGLDFAARYAEYEAAADRGELRVFRRVRAVELWRKMLTSLFETGHPWITFKDPCNLRSPQQHVGVVHSSNLCTEITLNTRSGVDAETAVCNLGSVNLPAHVGPDGLDVERLRRTVTTAVRMLDNVIDINLYTVPPARRSNLAHRPVGLGLMGFADALYTLGVPYASEAAVEFADTSMEQLSYFAISASSDLAAERGRYASYEGSLWSRGILPIDSVEILAAHRGGDLDQDRTQRLDWNALRQKVLRQGMRNSNVHGDRADRDDLEHHRGLAVHRADLPQPVRQGEHERRLHRRQRVSRPRTEASRPVGRGDGRRPQVLRRLALADRPHSRGRQGVVRHRLRDRRIMVGAGGISPAEVDRPGAVVEPVRRGAERPQARPAVPAGLAHGLQDDVLPALDIRDARGEVDAARDRRPAQRGLPDRGRASSTPRRRLGPANRRRSVAERARTRHGRLVVDDALACSIDNPDCEACQ